MHSDDEGQVSVAGSVRMTRSRSKKRSSHSPPADADVDAAGDVEDADEPLPTGRLTRSRVQRLSCKKSARQRAEDDGYIDVANSELSLPSLKERQHETRDRHLATTCMSSLAANSAINYLRALRGFQLLLKTIPSRSLGGGLAGFVHSTHLGPESHRVILAESQLNGRRPFPPTG